MDLLLKRDQTGNILVGSDRQLMQRAQLGDDLTLYIESTGYDEYIIFGNYGLNGERVSALSLPHLAHGDVPDPAALKREPISTSQYIYDSKSELNNVFVKDFLDEGQTLTTAMTNNPYYRSYTWYSSRRYREAPFTDLNILKSCGDQFKIRLDFTKDFQMIVKPDIIYFPDEYKNYLVKSSSMLLPTEFVADPNEYAGKNRPLVANEIFSLAYLNIGSDNILVIIHKQHAKVGIKVDDHAHQGTFTHQGTHQTQITRVACNHTILVPESG